MADDKLYLALVLILGLAAAALLVLLWRRW
jgi:hypothetical protein